MGRIAKMRGFFPSGSLYAPSTRPPSRSILARTSSASAGSESSRHSAGRRPRVPGLALRGVRFAGARLSPDLRLGLGVAIALCARSAPLEDPVAGDHRGEKDEALRRARAGQNQRGSRADARQSPAHSEHEAAENEPPVDPARGREEHRRTEQRPRAFLHERESTGGDRDRARHDERERRIPGAGEVEKAEHLRRVRHPGNEEPQPEDQARREGSRGIHGRPYCEIRWRATYTVAKPAAMNARVATIERGDMRETPHTPWPLVHPPP